MDNQCGFVEQQTVVTWPVSRMAGW
ncbi:hypothetical protein DSUL_140074 [Desulfovibrionales bacterium]